MWRRLPQRTELHGKLQSSAKGSPQICGSVLICADLRGISEAEKHHQKAVDPTIPGVHKGWELLVFTQTGVEINQSELKYVIMHEALG